MKATIDYYEVMGNKQLTFEGPGQIFRSEEIAAANEKERKRNADALDAIKEAGFIRYPLFLTDLDNNPVEKEAWVHPSFTPSNSVGFREKHGMNFNIYIPSYERAGESGTIKMLDKFGVENYYVCIDPSQFEKYSKVYPEEKLVIRDISFRDPDILDPVSPLKHPITMAGHAPLCNFTLAFSRSLGETHFWFLDDDFIGLAMKAHKGEGLAADEVYDKDNFYRCSNIEEEYGFNFQDFMRDLEEFTMKIRNPGFVGLEKFGTVFSLPVCFRRGTRVYSYYLTTNETQVTHIGRQNNDVITSIELTKHGLVNMLFEGISYNSGATQAGEGGQSNMYKLLGTLDKGKVLVRAQPNYSKMSYEYSRIHHSVDFNNYPKQRPVGRPKPQSR